MTVADPSKDLPEINETSLDSGALSGLAAIIHRFETPGQVTATVLQAGTPIRQVTLTVPPGGAGKAPQRLMGAAPGAGAPGGAQAGQAIDLFDLAQASTAASDLILASTTAQPGPTAQKPAGAAVDASGYGMFSAMRAPQGVAFVAKPAALGAAGGAGGGYDSRQLVPGDYFAVVLLRPGSYTVRNLVDGAQGQITLAAPAGGVGKTYTPPDTLIVECAAGGFTPASIQLKPLQGLAFRCSTAARIKIDWEAEAA